MSEPTPAVPDYLASPNAVFNDEGVEWRYGRAPDYTKTRKVWEEGRSRHHVSGSLPALVENLVKNWEVEASFKSRLQDWRMIDHQNYTFSMNGGSPQSAEHMLKVGTYNAIIAPNEYYSPENSDFASSHKTFKRMMPTFAWEVIEVYSGPPVVAFMWRHWGVMKNDYVGFNDKGEKVTAKAHGGPIEIFGVTVAQVDDKVRLQAVNTWMDPLEMFRQIAPYGVVNKGVMNRNAEMEAALDDAPSHDGQKIAEDFNQPNGHHPADGGLKEAVTNGTSHSNGLSESNVMSLSGVCPFATQGANLAESFATPQTNGHGSSSFPEQALVPEDKIVETTPVSTQTLIQEVTSSAPTNPSLASVTNETAHVDEAPVQQGAEMDIDKPEISVEPLRLHANGIKRPNSATETEVGASKMSKESADLDIMRDEQARFEEPRSIYSSGVTGDMDQVLAPGSGNAFAQENLAAYDGVDMLLEQPATEVHPHPKDMEVAIEPKAGEAVAASASSEETKQTQDEMSSIRPDELPTIMNRE